MKNNQDSNIDNQSGILKDMPVVAQSQNPDKLICGTRRTYAEKPMILDNIEPRKLCLDGKYFLSS